MKSTKAAILEAYNEIISERSKEVDQLENGKLVENKNGERFEVLAFSKKFEDVSKFDTSKLATTINENHNMEGFTWVAVKDAWGRTGVFTYGDEGVFLIQQREEPLNEHNEVDNSIVSAYMSVITEAEEEEVEGPVEEPPALEEPPVEEPPAEEPVEDEEVEDEEVEASNSDKPTISLSVFKTEIGDIEAIAKKYKVEANNFTKTNFGREIEFTVTGPKENLKNVVSWALELKGDDLEQTIKDEFPEL